MSVHVLRRIGSASFILCTACYLAGVTFELLNPSHHATWGSGNVGVTVAYAMATYCFAIVGWLVVHRDPRNVVGWLMLAIGLAWGYLVVTEGYVLYGLVTRPGVLPSPALVAALSSWAWLPAIGIMGTFLILLFPDGHLPSQRWRGVLWVAASTIVLASISEIFLDGPVDSSVRVAHNPVGIPALRGALATLDLVIVLLPVCILLSAAGLIVRFRRSSGIERLQLKWLATAGAVVAVIYFITMAGTLFFLTTTRTRVDLHETVTPQWLLTLQDAGLISFALIPLAIGVAILRHRLYDIDVVINKTVVFGMLAFFITAVYVAIVVGVGRLVGSGDRPDLALSVAATAVVAVAFQPVRERVQRFANRLVYGDRATPYEVLAEFADRVGGTYDAVELLPTMARTLCGGLGAARVEVWLATGAGFVREAVWPQPSGPDQPGPEPRQLSDLVGDRVVEVRHQGDLLGALCVTKSPGEVLNPTEEKLLDDVAAQAGLVLRNVRLIEELRSSRLRLVTTQDQERRRLERNLHDGAQQRLVAVTLMLRTAQAKAARLEPTTAAALDRAGQQLDAAITELRELARGIHPVVLTERGLSAAVSALAERSPVPVVVEGTLAERLPPAVEASLYFVVAEALTNVAKYAGATQATVTLRRTDDAVVVEVADDGIGGADETKGSGLRGLADRVAVVDGTLTVESPPGRGTHLTCRVPVRSVPEPRQDGQLAGTAAM